MSEREDYDRLADDLGAEAERLQEDSEKLEQEIGEVRQDWERKRADEAVPGAPPRPQDAEGEGRRECTASAAGALRRERCGGGGSR